MASLHITKLNKGIKKNILQRNYSIEEVLQIKEGVNQVLVDRKKGMRLAKIILASVCVLMLVMLGMTMGLTKLFWIISAMTVAGVMVAFVFAWFATSGLFKWQYNNAVKKAYPDEIERLCIK